MPAIPRSFIIVIGLVAAASSAAGQGAPERAAQVNGVPITAAEVDAKLGNNLAKLQEQIYSLRQKQLDSMIDQTLLEAEAARRGTTVAAVVQSEITSQVAPVTADETAKFYEENKARLPADFKTLEEQIRTYLNAQRLETKQQEFLKSLRAAAKIEVFLTPPPILRSEVVTAGAPARGPADAPVTIVEFSDFHCPFCRRVQPVLDQVRAKYDGKIRMVFRDFPIDTLHPQARAAAEAARCATEQGKFWEFHDLVFKNDADALPATLDGFAKTVGLDVPAFEACRTSGKYKNPVQTSNVEGARLGITGTPTFFINGRILVGAQPFEAFAKIIDEELALGRPGR